MGKITEEDRAVLQRLLSEDEGEEVEDDDEEWEDDDDEFVYKGARYRRVADEDDEEAPVQRAERKKPAGRTAKPPTKRPAKKQVKEPEPEPRRRRFIT